MAVGIRVGAVLLVLAVVLGTLKSMTVIPPPPLPPPPPPPPIPEPTTKDCVHGNKTYKHNEEWKPSDCRACNCYDGRVQCASIDCFAVQCVDFHYVKGECCAVCPNGPNCMIMGMIKVSVGQWKVNCHGDNCTCVAPGPLTSPYESCL